MLLFAFVSIAALPALAQTNQARSLVTQPVNENQMLVLHGNTHPLARAEFDQGAAPASLPMENIQLVLKRSPEQEAALTELLREQQDPSSPNYHKGVTPEEFGARFGASDHDIQAVTSWLQSHGLRILEVSPGRNIIQFSGTAAQVEAALRSSIHSYVVKGEQHWANASDPQIPAALTDIVAGVNTLHNFRKKPMSHMIGTFSRSNATGEVKPLHPEFTFDLGSPCGGFSTAGCFAVAPFDFATIYNVLPLWNAGIDGTGVTIAIVGDSNINPADVTNFRSIFGLPAKAPIVIIADNGTDPGIKPPPNGDELESDLDVEWAGAVAKGATIDFVISADTNGTAGVDLAAEHIIKHNLAPVMSESFGACELALGTGGNTFYNSLWQMGAAEMITIVVSTGDNGSSACDFPNSNQTKALPASSGLQVSGIASTPFNIAVGGTDFDQLSNPTAFWNTTSAGSTELSAKGYIPETTWNDSCTNVDFILVGFNALPEINCNDTKDIAQSIDPIGASGGVSNCTTPSTSNPPKCAGGYAKPAFQIGPGVPNDGKRDIPDVSLFAGDGLVGSFFIICEQDQNNPSTNNPCSLASPDNDTVGVGGTSASAQAFAGIMALVVQKTGNRQGIGAATAMYELAAKQSVAGCNSSAPASTCVFNDVTKGTISQPCVKNSPNCIVATSSDANGILSGCDAAAGYDLATGLGTINAENLVNNFTNGAGAGSVDFSLSLTNCTSTITVSPGGAGSFTAVITEMNGFNSALTFTCAPMPSKATCAVTTTNIDATHISAKVTVTTMAASRMIPGGPPPSGRGLWIQRSPIALAFLVSVAIILFLVGFCAKHRRLSAAMALVVLALIVTMAACGGGGGGGGGGGNPGTPASVSNPTFTASGGGSTHSMNFTLIVE
jgi:subtilase family serine protease